MEKLNKSTAFSTAGWQQNYKPVLSGIPSGRLLNQVKLSTRDSYHITQFVRTICKLVLCLATGGKDEILIIQVSFLSYTRHNDVKQEDNRLTFIDNCSAMFSLGRDISVVLYLYWFIWMSRMTKALGFFVRGTINPERCYIRILLIMKTARSIIILLSILYRLLGMLPNIEH